jgi:hypothetical protein
MDIEALTRLAGMVILPWSIYLSSLPKEDRAIAPGNRDCDCTIGVLKVLTLAEVKAVILSCFLK